MTQVRLRRRAGIASFQIRRRISAGRRGKSVNVEGEGVVGVVEAVGRLGSGDGGSWGRDCCPVWRSALWSFNGTGIVADIHR